MARLVLAALSLLLLAAPVSAYDWELQAETVGQGYQVRRFLGDGSSELLTRRRLSQSLGLGVYNLLPEGWTDEGRRNQLYVVTQLRFDADFGSYPAYVARQDIPELERYQFELLYGFVGGRDLLGRVDFQLGRQIAIDLMDFYAFDGLLLRLRAPGHVAVELLGGAAVRPDWPVASPIYWLDGTSANARDPRARPEQEDAPAGTYGVALETWGLNALFTRLAYRATMSPTRGRLPDEPAAATNEEGITWQARGRLLGGVLVPMVGLRYDLMQARLSQVVAELRAAPWRRHALVVEYFRDTPIFDGDSIFNVFATEPYQDVRAGWDFSAAGIQGYARGFLRLFADSAGLDGGAAAGAVLLWPRGLVRCDAYYEDGYGGRRTGLDARSSWEVARGWLAADGRVTVANTAVPSDVGNRIGEVAAVTSVGLQGGLLWTPARALAVHLLAEGNLSGIERELRLLGVLEIHGWLFPTYRKGQR